MPYTQGRRALERREDEDTVRIYRLCAPCEDRVEILGRGARSEDPDVYIV